MMASVAALSKLAVDASQAQHDTNWSMVTFGNNTLDAVRLLNLPFGTVFNDERTYGN